MAENVKKTEQINNDGASEMENMENAPVATPNRDAYRDMWGEDNNDVDFEDKEARYGRAIEDRNELRERRKSDAVLGGLFDKHNWLAVMYKELNDNPDMNPFEWLAGFCEEQGISIQEVLDDPEAQKRLTEKIAKFKEEQAKSAEFKKTVEGNLEKSGEALSQIQSENNLTDEECASIWGDFWRMHEEAEQGNVSVDVWKAFIKSRNYDNDVKSAREEGGMQARNEKIQNKVRSVAQNNNLPPTLNQGAGASTKKNAAKKESFLSGLNDNI